MGGLLEPRSSRLQSTMITPLHSSLGVSKISPKSQKTQNHIPSTTSLFQIMSYSEQLEVSTLTYLSLGDTVQLITE